MSVQTDSNRNFISIDQRYQLVKQDIEKASSNANRNPNSVQLLAVSKRKPAQDIRKMAGLGQKEFGENYLQEALDKQTELEDLALNWHFIGPIQSNKTTKIAENFCWVHTVDREKIAKRLDSARPKDKGTLQVLVQVNISDEDSKSGCSVEALQELCHLVNDLPMLTLRGLMVIPKAESDYDKQLETFKRVEQHFNQLRKQFETVDTLSMGMTGDLQAAVAAGSTMVRIGTALFGARE